MNSSGATSLMAVVDLSNHGTHQQWCQCAGEGIERAAGLYQLVATIAAAAKQVKHGVDNGVEHADAEPANESAQQVDDKIEHYRLTLDAERGHVGTDKAGQVLDKHADKTDGKGN